MPTTIDYASSKTRRPAPTLRYYTLLLLSLTALSIFICITIEILNAHAGFFLPRDIPPDAPNPKWHSDGAFPLLHDTISTLGLLQYPLTLLLLIALPITFLQHKKPNPFRLPLALAFLSTLLCTSLMLYRGYFTSLGW